MHSPTSTPHPLLVVNARRRRQSASPAARRLWIALRSGQLGVRFRRQHPAGAVIFDFYCPQRRLAIHLSPESPTATARGCRCLYVSTEEIFQELPGVLGRIRAALETV